MTSSSLAARFQAFYALLALAPSAPNGVSNLASEIPLLLAAYPADAAQITSALTTLLSLELNDPNIGTLAATPEDESSVNFSLDIIEAVVSLRNPQTIPLLVQVIDTGAMVTDTLASFGPASLDPVLQGVYSNNVQVRHATAYTLATMLSAQYAYLYADQVSRSKVRAGLGLAVSSFRAPYAAFGNAFQSTLKALPPVPSGDLNGDGLVNCADVALIKASFGKKVGQPGFDIRADINGDGVVNVLDLSSEARLMPVGTTCN
jgi:hypothetical protein